MDVSVRAKRILSPMSSYREESVLDSDQLSFIELVSDEVCIGVYENSFGDLSDCVFITNKGLHILKSNCRKFVSYLEIVGIQTPADKVGGTCICLMISGGDEVVIEIKNGNGRFKDVFEFLRFLDRVIEDQAA